MHPYIKVAPAGAPVDDGRHHPTPPPPPASWTIPNLCRAYAWPEAATGVGTIAIVELGGGYSDADVVAAFAAMKLPAPTITNISVDGTTNNAGYTGNPDDGEVALDIQVAGASFTVATGAAADIVLFWGQDIGACVKAAADHGCAVCSISWGADEREWGRNAGDAMEAAAAYAVAKGTVVFAAAGDNDSADGGPGAANVDLPASAPSVIGCGGTNKPQTGEETVWNNNPGLSDGEGTGGGYSTLFPGQSWQMGAPPPPHNLGRMVPDVSANADPQTGYEIMLGGTVQIFGGTSAVAPLYAGLFAAFGSALGFITPTLYQRQVDFNDIISGNNGAYSAGVGPDPCTGIGSPIGIELFATFSPVVATS